MQSKISSTNHLATLDAQYRPSDNIRDTFKENGKIILIAGDKDSIKDPYQAQRLQKYINAFLITRNTTHDGNNVYAPYIQYDLEGNRWIETKDRKSTLADSKSYDIVEHLKNIEGSLSKEQFAKRGLHRRNISGCLDELFSKEQPYFGTKTLYTPDGSTKEIPFSRTEIHILQGLYNLMGESKEVFWSSYTNTSGGEYIALNHQGKTYLLNAIYEIIDGIHGYNNHQIQEIFQGSSRSQIIHKKLTPDGVDAEIILLFAKFLLSHHQTTKGSSHYIPKDDPHYREKKERRNNIKAAKGNIINRVMSKFFLENTFNNQAIESVYGIIDQNTDNSSPIDTTLNTHGYYTQTKTRLKNQHSQNNKVLRSASNTHIQDHIGLQTLCLLGDNDEENMKQMIAIFKSGIAHINNKTIIVNGKSYTIKIAKGKIDNKNMIPQDSEHNFIKTINAHGGPSITKRIKKKKNNITYSTNNLHELAIINHINNKKKGSNKDWTDLKIIYTANLVPHDHNESTISGINIEHMILPLGKSIEKNEGGHAFLDRQKETDVHIRENGQISFKEYCRQSDIAITKTAANVSEKIKFLRQLHKKSQHEKWSNDKRKALNLAIDVANDERFYDIEISHDNRAMVNSLIGIAGEENLSFFIKDDVLRIDLMQLNSVYDHPSHRLAADIIILDQLKTELISGKLTRIIKHNEEESTPSQITIGKVAEGTYDFINNISRSYDGSIIESLSHHFTSSHIVNSLQTGQYPLSTSLQIPIPDKENPGHYKSLRQASVVIAQNLKSENIMDSMNIAI